TRATNRSSNRQTCPIRPNVESAELYNSGLGKNLQLQPEHGSFTQGQALNLGEGGTASITRRPIATTGEKPRHAISSRVFKLMDTCCDNQDSSVVEKVILSEKNIFSLCNMLTAGSAKSSDGQRMIDFAKLDRRESMVIGFYGSKEIMLDIFRELGIAAEDSTWSQMK
ncbi:hypothetical protein R1flu_017477, partial [Riccia fluitans]